VKQQLTRTSERFPLDEDTFQHLLAAAYLVQEQAGRPQPEPPNRDHTRTLSEIVETQRLIHSQQLDLSVAMSLIAERVQKITSAAGVAIGMVEGKELLYRAATGSAAGEVGSRLAVNDCLSAYCLRSGQVLLSPDSQKDSRLSVKLCRKRGLRSLIALPVYHEGKVVGVLELWFAGVDAFQEHDVHTCQLMAGLVGEAIVRNAELEWKQALATERATMLEALEKLKPQLERLTAQPAAAPPAVVPAEATPPASVPPAGSENIASPAAASSEPQIQPATVVPTQAQPQQEAVAVPPAPVTETQPVPGRACSGCGHQLREEESFCGLCGTARDSELPFGARLQSKWAYLWRMQQAAEAKSNGTPTVDAKLSGKQEMEPPAEEATADLPEVDFSDLDFSAADSTTIRIIEAPQVESEESAESQAIVPAPAPSSPWSSALRARAWLESLKAQRPDRVWLTQQWRARRANVYLLAAAILLLAVLSGLATRSAPNTIPGSAVSVVNARRRRTPPPPQLTLFEQMLVALGLAEPPPASAYLGNPKTQVWVDVHTALYYCPSADLYGKTPGGKFTTQQDAQQDQFEPANRKACD
jgi:GAF domain-containing protein